MKAGEYFASMGRKALPLVAVLSLAGCDLGPSGERSADESAARLVPPPFVAESRTIDPARLSVQLTVDGMNTDPQLIDGTWISRFRLPEDETRDYTVVVVWSYTLPRSEESIVVARTEPRSIGLSLPNREIVVSRTDYVRPDDDGDGLDNLLEIEVGRDPTVADPRPVFSPRAGQGDCRETPLGGDAVADERAAPREELPFFSEPAELTRAIELPAGRQLYFATFLLEVAGTLVVEHLSGEPADTNALLYDRVADAAPDQLTANVSFLANDTGASDGERARIAAAIAEPGLYCYALFDGRADLGTGADLVDTVIGVSFVPNGAGAAGG